MDTKRDPQQMCGWFDEDLTRLIEQRRREKVPVTFFKSHRALRRSALGLDLIGVKAVTEDYCQRHGMGLPLAPDGVTAGVARALLLIEVALLTAWALVLMNRAGA